MSICGRGQEMQGNQGQLTFPGMESRPPLLRWQSEPASAAKAYAAGGFQKGLSDTKVAWKVSTVFKKGLLDKRKRWSRRCGPHVTIHVKSDGMWVHAEDPS
jgi:hypothetical protein